MWPQFETNGNTVIAPNALSCFFSVVQNVPNENVTFHIIFCVCTLLTKPHKRYINSLARYSVASFTPS